MPRHNTTALREYRQVRDQLPNVLSIAIGFLIGAAAGAVAFVVTGVRGALLAVVIVVALALWVLYRENSVPC